MEFESFDLWTHPFCLSCDKQTEGAAYCSESCRLADFEKPSGTHSYPASPASDMSSSWNSQSTNAKFYLSPAFDFSKPQVYSRSPYSSSASSPTTAPSWQRGNSYQNTCNYTRNRSSNASMRSLTPSSSHCSLSSMESSATASRRDNLLVSEKARRELQDYAKQFEHVRSNRRRSY
ncbi:hypothetical protein Cpir12675_003260 [Ceratocystis pirilliformis]|uniref:Life-span regulatory factor n=1 Tax=Ceratocystis pirilliformis TaxID=259994 RepID=A0ABR3Z476_9PEZI